MNQSKMFYVALSVAGLLPAFEISSAQGTFVECPDITTGVLCTSDQVAICWVTSDSSSERCLTPPDGVTGLSLDLWLLSYVMDDTLTVTDESIASYQAILKRGVWECSRYKVAFTLPGSWKGTR